MLTDRVMDFIEIDKNFAIVKTTAPAESWGRSLGESALRRTRGVTVVGVQRRGADFIPAQAETQVSEGDVLIVAGPTDAINRFAALR